MAFVVDDVKSARDAVFEAGGGTVGDIVSVEITGSGEIEFVLAAALALEGLEGVVVLSAGTDGTDGPTDAAGAVADGQTVSRARELGRQVDFVLPVHGLYSNVASKLVAPLGTSAEITGLDGYIGQVWTAALEPRHVLEMARLLDESGDHAADVICPTLPPLPMIGQARSQGATRPLISIARIWRTGPSLATRNSASRPIQPIAVCVSQNRPRPHSCGVLSSVMSLP